MEEKEKQLRQVKNEVVKVGFERYAKEAGSVIMDTVSSIFGASKIKKLEQEIDHLNTNNETIIQENKDLRQEMQAKEQEHQNTTNSLKQELDKIHNLFPKLKELLRIERLCEHLGFGKELIKKILDMKSVGFRGKLYSSEYQRHFETEYSVAEIKQHSTDENKLKLTIDGINDTSWFKKKQKEFLEKIGIKPQEPKRQQGIKR